MEPPGTGGSKSGLDQRVGQAAAAMEPALTGGSTSKPKEFQLRRQQRRNRARCYSGSTRVMADAGRTRDVAAMEPAAERRKHELLSEVGVCQDLAAMEPAAKRREYALRGSGKGKEPRWRAPVTGGNTAAAMTPYACVNSPQWSPPVTDGNTAPKSGPSDLR